MMNGETMSDNHDLLPERLRILHLEDETHDAELVQETLESGGIRCAITRVQTRDEFVRFLEQGTFDLIISDYSLPSFNGKAALAIARKKYPEIPFLFVSGTIGEDAAIESLLNGATDYVLKQKMSRLIPALKRALRESKERRERRLAEETLKNSEESFRLMFANNPHPMWVYYLETFDSGIPLYIKVNNPEQWNRHKVIL